METVRFEEMGLSEEIQKAVRYMGFEEASPIQAKAIPAMISGIDLIGQAQTGTGKTAAFGIPLLEKVDPKLKKLQAIVLCPTRELAIQVADEIRNLSRYMHGIKVLPIYGGQDIVKQLKDKNLGEALYLPRNVLRSGADLFLDDYTLADVEGALQVPVNIVKSSGYDLVDALLGEDTSE